MITERTLKQWRRNALKGMEADMIGMYEGTAANLAAAYKENLKRILCMTQELLDLHLTRK